MQEKANISRVRNGDATLIMKLEQAQVPQNDHNTPDSNIKGETAHSKDNSTDSNDSSIKGKPACDDVGIIGNSSNHNHNHNHNTHPCKASDFGTSNSGKFMYNPGRCTPNSKDGSTHGDSDSISISNKPCAADSHCICNHNCDKTILTAPDINPIFSIDSAQAVPVCDIILLHSIDNAPTVPCDDSMCNAGNSSSNSMSHAVNNYHNLDRDHNKTIALPPDTNAVNSSNSSISNNTASIADTCHIPPALHLGSNDTIIGPDNDDSSSGNSIIDNYGTNSNNNNSISHSILDNTPRIVNTTCALNTNAVTSGIADTTGTLDTNHADSKSNTSSHSHSNTVASGTRAPQSQLQTRNFSTT